MAPPLRRAPALSIFAKLVCYYNSLLLHSLKRNFPFSYIQEYRPLTTNIRVVRLVYWPCILRKVATGLVIGEIN